MEFTANERVDKSDKSDKWIGNYITVDLYIL